MAKAWIKGEFLLTFNIVSYQILCLHNNKIGHHTDGVWIHFVGEIGQKMGAMRKQ